MTRYLTLAEVRTKVVARGPDAERWCLVRWKEPIGAERGSPKTYFCGPLSFLSAPLSIAHFGNLGFPNGEVGEIAIFDSADEASLRAEGRHIWEDVPTRLSEMHFSVRVYSHYEGRSAVLYDEGDYDEAVSVRGAALGRIAGQPNPGYFKCSLECRPLVEPIGVARIHGGASSPESDRAIDDIARATFACIGGGDQ